MKKKQKLFLKQSGYLLEYSVTTWLFCLGRFISLNISLCTTLIIAD